MADMEKNMEEQIREAALRILDYGDNTEQELFDKLSRKGFDAPLIRSVLDGFQEAGLIDDKRYGENYIQSALESGKGPAWIRDRLLRKGVPAEVILDLLESSASRYNENTLCLRKALSLCHLSSDFDLDENDVPVPSDTCRWLDEPAAVFGPTGRVESDFAARQAARKQYDKEKARLIRRLTSAGFSTGAVLRAVRLIESL